MLKLVTLWWPYCCIALVLLNPLPTNWCHSSMHFYVLKRIKCDFFVGRDVFLEQGMVEDFGAPINSKKGSNQLFASRKPFVVTFLQNS